MDYRTRKYRFQDDLDQGSVASALNVLAGIWLIVSPWIYTVASAQNGGVWNSVIVGIVITFFAASRFLGSYDRTLSWLNALLGLWMIVSPWVYGYSGASGFTWNSVIVGIIVAILGTWSATAPASARETWGRGAAYGGGTGWEPTYWYGYGPGMFGAPRYGGGWGDYGRTDYRGRGPKGYRRTDEAIREQVCDRMADSPVLDPTDVEVRVANGEVTLQGTVPSRHERRLAEDISDSVSGVVTVHNELRVVAGGAPRDVRRVA